MADSSTKSNPAQDKQADENRITPKMYKKWMHCDLESEAVGGESPGSGSGSGSDGVGGHEFDAVLDVLPVKLGWWTSGSAVLSAYVLVFISFN